MPDPAIATSCAGYATAYCALLDKCFDGETISRFGKKANCVPRVTLDCKTRFGLADVAVATTSVDACTAALPAASCTSALENVLPPACTPEKGKRTNGQPCIDRAQCSSGHCQAAKTGACGSCADPPALGAKCASSFMETGCDPQQACESDTCGKIVALGATCDASNHCGAHFSCLKGKCVKAAALGDTCDLADPNAPACDWNEVCQPVCQSINVLEYDTMDCTMGLRLVCGGHATCNTSCVPPPVEGQPCGAATDPAEKCQWPAVCENSQCVLGTATTCK